MDGIGSFVYEKWLWVYVGIFLICYIFGIANFYLQNTTKKEILKFMEPLSKIAPKESTSILSKNIMSVWDEYAKSAITGMLANQSTHILNINDVRTACESAALLADLMMIERGKRQ